MIAPPAVTTLFGDLLLSDEKLIAQQTNCCSVKPHGLSQSIARKYSFVSVYSKRKGMGNRNHCVLKDRSVPGTVEVYRSNDGPTVACLFGQYYMGKSGVWGPRYSSQTDPLVPDGVKERKAWFWNALLALSKWIDDRGWTDHNRRVAMPYKIGCDLAGGDWNVYRAMLDKWSSLCKIHVVLYRLK